MPPFSLSLRSWQRTGGALGHQVSRLATRVVRRSWLVLTVDAGAVTDFGEGTGQDGEDREDKEGELH